MIFSHTLSQLSYLGSCFTSSPAPYYPQKPKPFLFQQTRHPSNSSVQSNFLHTFKNRFNYSSP